MTGAVLSAAVAFAIGSAPWMVLLARTFDGTPELDELAHLTGMLDNVARARFDTEARSAMLAARARKIKQQALRRAKINQFDTGRGFVAAESVILLARSLHQRVAPSYATLRGDLGNGPRAILDSTLMVDRRGLDIAIVMLSEGEMPEDDGPSDPQD